MKQYFIINEDNSYGGSVSTCVEGFIYTELEPKKSTDTWNGLEWIAIENLEQTKETVRQFLAKKKQDGRNYFNEIELNITMQLTGMMLVDLVAVSEQIDSILYKPLNLIQKGDYFSAMMLFQNPSKIEPTHPIVLNYWNNMKAYCIAYFNENYPTETID